MLASLTGLLLTLGGDQPAVVFDPPLDPAVFDWDGVTLRVREDALPLNLEFGTPVSENPQRVIINRTVDIREPIPYIFEENLGAAVISQLQFFSDCCSGEQRQSFLGFGGNSVYDGQVFFLASAESNSRVPLIEFRPRVPSNFESRIESLEQALKSCQCASDLDGDGAVGFTDLVELISVWGPCSA